MSELEIQALWIGGTGERYPKGCLHQEGHVLRVSKQGCRPGALTATQVAAFPALLCLRTPPHHLVRHVILPLRFPTILHWKSKPYFQNLQINLITFQRQFLKPPEMRSCPQQMDRENLLFIIATRFLKRVAFQSSFQKSFPKYMISCVCVPSAVCSFNTRCSFLS